MKIIDYFFKMIFLIQNLLERFERWYLKKEKYLAWVFWGDLLIAFILLFLNQTILGEMTFILGMVFVGIGNIVGWKCSVRKWFKICVIYNLFFSAILASVLQGVIKDSIALPLFVVIYLISWMFLSLLSNSKISLLVNEVVSGMSATIFTIGTYLINFYLKEMPLLNTYYVDFQTEEAFVQALKKGDSHALDVLKIGLLEMLENVFMSLLPIIGVTAISVIMIKIKIYWMEKNDICEPEMVSCKKG